MAPREAIQREMKKRLGVGADTIDTLEKPPFKWSMRTGRGYGSTTPLKRVHHPVRQPIARDAIELRASAFIWSPSKMNCAFVTGSTACSRKFPFRRKSSGFSGDRFAGEDSQHLSIAESVCRRTVESKFAWTTAKSISMFPFRCSTAKAVVLRLLRQDATLLGMMELGMDERELNSFVPYSERRTASFT